MMAPLYRRDLNLGVAFVKAYQEHINNNTLYLVFSDEDEMTDFTDMVEAHPNVYYLVCTEQLDEAKKPISQKKIWGVREIFNNDVAIENVMVVDIDSLVTKGIDIDTEVANRVNNRKIWASESSNDSIINKVGNDAYSRFFDGKPNSNSQIMELTNGFRKYFWFNEIPIYQRQYFESWLTYIDYDNKKDRLLYTTFDYMLYAWYLLTECGWELKDIEGAVTTDQGSFLETQTLQPNFEERFNEMAPLWIKKPFEGMHDNVFMQLHVNR